MPENPLVLVRPNLPRDATAVAELIVAACQQAYAFFAWNETVASIGEWLAEDPLRWSETWVAEANGSVVAFMALEDNFIDQLFVAPPWQGKAIGARLMALAKPGIPMVSHCTVPSRTGRRSRFTGARASLW